MSAPLVVGATRHGQTEKDKLAQAEQILVDRLHHGLRPSELMEKYGISKAVLYRRLDAAVHARIAPTVDAYREQQNAALDELVARWERQEKAGEAMIEAGVVAEEWGRVEKGMTMRAQALEAKLRILDRRAKLNGLDAPVKAEVTVTVNEGVDARIEALLDEMETRENA